MTAVQTSLSPELLEVLGERVAAHMGLHYPAGKSAELQRGLSRAAPAVGFKSPQDLAAAIVAGALSEQQIDVLATYLVIGETYFFRHKQAFDALEQHVVPERMRARDGSGDLRIWSAACSNGAEPYSISIACSRAASPAGPPGVRILATDINRVALETAKAAIYTRWWLRDTAPSFAADYFIDRGNGKFELRPQYRANVTFAYHNLVGDRSGLPAEATSLDVVFCRNVLMYFSPEQRRVATNTLQESLAEGGYLFVAPSEVGEDLFPDLTLTEVGGTFVFQKRAPKPRQPRQRSKSMPKVPQAGPRRETSATAATAPSRSQPSHRTKRPTARHSGQSGSARRGSLPAEAPSTPQALLAQARTLANGGQAEEALAVCDTIHAQLRLSPAYHFLRATILQELSRWEGAAAELNRALYLDADFVMAHFVLANLNRRSGDQAGASRHFDAVTRILRRLPSDAVLSDSDGMTAGELRELVP